MASITVFITILLCIQHVYSSADTCLFCIGAVTDLSGIHQPVGELVAAGYKMALHDYENFKLYDIDFFAEHIHSLNESCLIDMQLRDIKSNIKVGIQQIFGLAYAYDQCDAENEPTQPSTHETECSINMPFILGPNPSGDVLDTNPLVEAFDLLQFSATATSTFLSSYSTVYRSIPSDDYQAKALIDLCHYFKWDEIGILYMNSDYGTSLQGALTSYANNRSIKSTAFSYIISDNITLTNSVSHMKRSNIFIFILIVYDGDVPKLSSLLRNDYHMVGYPYYYIGTDGWLYSNSFQHNYSLDIFGGLIGTCPWAPRIQDTDKELPYPLNISLHMYKSVYSQWVEWHNQGDYTITYGFSEPGLFTVYAYDIMLTIIKLIDEFIYKHNIQSIDAFWERIYDEDEDVSAQFADILNGISFIGLSGHVSYSLPIGDRNYGLFSYCNVNPIDSSIYQIGYYFDDNVTVNTSNIQWPLYSYSSSSYPQSSYKTKNNGIRTKNGVWLPIFIWTCMFVSIAVTIIYLLLLYIYRTSSLIRAAQWKLNLFMVIGCMVCYLSLILFGIDESFPYKNKTNYNWNMLCNIRFFCLNLSFSFIYGPLCAKIYRIYKIFKNAMTSLKRQKISDQKLFVYNFIWISVDSALCMILLILIPFRRVYVDGDMVNYITIQWGQCSTDYGYIYLLVLGVPKLILSVYCMIISISVYSTVSMMKFNEGLQVLVCIVVSSIFIFIAVLVTSTTTIKDATTSVFSYSFMSFILFMVCHFCCAVMVLPRICAVWRGHDETYEAQHDEGKAVKAYFKMLKSRLNAASSRLSIKFSDESIRSIKSMNMNKRESYTVSLKELNASNYAHTPQDSEILQGMNTMTQLPMILAEQREDIETETAIIYNEKRHTADITEFNVNVENVLTANYSETNTVILDESEEDELKEEDDDDDDDDVEENNALMKLNVNEPQQQIQTDSCTETEN